jgi:hypothetical protein
MYEAWCLECCDAGLSCEACCCCLLDEFGHPHAERGRPPARFPVTTHTQHEKSGCSKDQVYTQCQGFPDHTGSVWSCCMSYDILRAFHNGYVLTGFHTALPSNGTSRVLRICRVASLPIPQPDQ